MRESSTSDLNQVFCGESSKSFIVDTNKIRDESRQDAINQLRNRLFFDPEEKIYSRAARCDDQCIETPCQQLIDFLHLDVRIFLGGRNDKVVTAPPQFSPTFPTYGRCFQERR